jgi:putative two-component system response regulator
MENQKKKILIVDDDEISLKFAELMLQDDYTAITAKSGTIALEHLEHFRYGFIPDLILLDIIMPFMDGWETFKRIKEIIALKDVPVIFLTSAKEKEWHRRAMDIGADDYIEKPYDRASLLKKIEELLTSKEVTSQIPLLEPCS